MHSIAVPLERYELARARASRGPTWDIARCPNPHYRRESASPPPCPRAPTWEIAPLGAHATRRCIAARRGSIELKSRPDPVCVIGTCGARGAASLAVSLVAGEGKGGRTQRDRKRRGSMPSASRAFWEQELARARASRFPTWEIACRGDRCVRFSYLLRSTNWPGRGPVVLPRGRTHAARIVAAMQRSHRSRRAKRAVPPQITSAHQNDSTSSRLADRSRSSRFDAAVRRLRGEGILLGSFRRVRRRSRAERAVFRRHAQR